MAVTQKALTDRDPQQTLQACFNDEDSTLSVNGFLTGKVGRRFDLALSTTTILNDTETYTFSENGSQLYVFVIVYTDGSRSQPLYGSRTA